jgi:hypothetical protein
VQGDALGGGFEMALCLGRAGAEESAMIGLPEILFTWFPGMGALQPARAARERAASAEERSSPARFCPRRDCTKWASSTCSRRTAKASPAVQAWIAKNARRRSGFQGVDAGAPAGESDHARRSWTRWPIPGWIARCGSKTATCA